MLRKVFKGIDLNLKSEYQDKLKMKLLILSLSCEAAFSPWISSGIFSPFRNYRYGMSPGATGCKI